MKCAKAKKERLKASQKPLVAYMVSDGDERATVVFARSPAAARRVGGREIDLDWDEVNSCQRAREFDCFAPGPVPKLALIESGWWFECHGCARPIRFEPYDDGVTDVSSENVVEDGQSIYCSEICKADSGARDAEAKAVAASGVATMVHYLMSSTPIARIERTHAFAFHRGTSIELTQVIVDFSLPGLPNAGQVRYEDHFRMRRLKPVRPHAQIFLYPPCLAAFEAFHVARAIEQGWHRWDDDGGALHPQSDREWAAA